MFALMSWLKGGSEAASPAAAIVPVASDGIVLPRFLRRPARLLGRLTDGNFEAPRYSASILTIGLLSVAGIYGAYLGGQFPIVVQAVTSRLGFAIDEVKVSGNHETSEIDILDRLGLDGWTSTIGFDAEAARRQIADLPWVQAAAVRKIYPDTLQIQIEERKPFAIWQHGSELSLVEESGRVIAPYAAAAMPCCRWSSASARRRRRRHSSPGSRAIPSWHRASRATSGSPNGAGTSGSRTA